MPGSRHSLTLIMVNVWFWVSTFEVLAGHDCVTIRLWVEVIIADCVGLLSAKA